MNDIEVRINKEVRDYQEGIFFGLTLCGFYRYNSMTFEQFILAVIRSELLYPKRLVFKSDHLYTKALENTTIKEALKLD